MNEKKSNKVLLIVILIVLVVGGYFIYKKYFDKKDDEVVPDTNKVNNVEENKGPSSTNVVLFENLSSKELIEKAELTKIEETVRTKVFKINDGKLVASQGNIKINGLNNVKIKTFINLTDNENEIFVVSEKNELYHSHVSKLKTQYEFEKIEMPSTFKEMYTSKFLGNGEVYYNDYKHYLFVYLDNNELYNLNINKVSDLSSETKASIGLKAQKTIKYNKSQIFIYGEQGLVSDINLNFNSEPYMVFEQDGKIIEKQVTYNSKPIKVKSMYNSIVKIDEKYNLSDLYIISEDNQVYKLPYPSDYSKTNGFALGKNYEPKLELYTEKKATKMDVTEEDIIISYEDGQTETIKIFAYNASNNTSTSNKSRFNNR